MSKAAKKVATARRVVRRTSAAHAWNPTRMRIARTVQSVTLDDVAAGTGISRSVLHSFERPPGRGPNDTEIATLAAYFGVKPAYFVGRTLTLREIAAID